MTNKNMQNAQHHYLPEKVNQNLNEMPLTTSPQ